MTQASASLALLVGGGGRQPHRRQRRGEDVRERDGQRKEEEDAGFPNSASACLGSHESCVISSRPCESRAEDETSPPSLS